MFKAKKGPLARGPCFVGFHAMSGLWERPFRMHQSAVCNYRFVIKISDGQKTTKKSRIQVSRSRPAYGL
jgi:hypothetical protein